MALVDEHWPVKIIVVQGLLVIKFIIYLPLLLSHHYLEIF